jgi:hypothetical protein
MAVGTADAGKPAARVAKERSARDVGDDTFPPQRENGLKKRAKATESATSLWTKGRSSRSESLIRRESVNRN